MSTSTDNKPNRLEQFTKNWTDVVLKYRWPVLLATLVLAMGLGYGGQFIAFDGDYHAFFKKSNPQLQALYDRSLQVSGLPINSNNEKDDNFPHLSLVYSQCCTEQRQEMVSAVKEWLSASTTTIAEHLWQRQPTTQQLNTCELFTRTCVETHTG